MRLRDAIEEDGILYGYGRGSFDNHCVFIINKDKKETPTDDILFKTIQDYCNVNKCHEQFWKDIADIAETIPQRVKTDNIPSTVLFDIIPDYDTMLPIIRSKAEAYTDRPELIKKTFIYLYLAMISEENKKYTKLGKTIKLLGLHNILFDKMAPTFAANFSKGKKWFDIKMVCMDRERMKDFIIKRNFV